MDNAQLLRNVVAWMDSRDEYLNDNKSYQWLVQEYVDFCKKVGIKPDRS